MTTELRDYEPCSHPGCLSHISHPCEGCGRVGGKQITGDQTAGAKWVIAKPVYSNRPSVYSSGHADVTWIPDLRYGLFESSVAAKRQYLYDCRELNPVNGPHSDEFVRAVFKSQINLGVAKTMRIIWPC